MRTNVRHIRFKTRQHVLVKICLVHLANHGLERVLLRSISHKVNNHLVSVFQQRAINHVIHTMVGMLHLVCSTTQTGNHASVKMSAKSLKMHPLPVLVMSLV